MKKFYNCFVAVLICIACFGTYNVQASPGTASASADTICVVDFTTLLLTGYSGTIQWQSFDGSTWINETNTGFDTDAYSVQPGVTTDYRALVTDSVSNVDTSNVVTILVVMVPAPSVVNASRCGLGPITLSATGTGLTTWYSDSMSTMSIHEGDTFNTSITQTTTYYVSTIDTSSGGSSGSGDPVLMGGTFGATNGSTENGFNVINTSSDDIQINTINWEWDLGTGDVAVVVNPTGGNIANAASGLGWSTYETFVGITANGANVGTPTTFTTPLIIPAGATVGIAFDVVSGSITNSYQTGNGTAWVSTEWTDGTLIITEGEAGGPPGGGLGGFSPRAFWGTIEYEFVGLFCESPRVPVTATVTTPPAMSIDAYPSNLICGGDTVSLTPVSANSGYNYTWSPLANIDSVYGDSAVVFASTTGTYYLYANDGTCAAFDSVLIDVGTPTTAGVASVAEDSLCSGYTIPLNLTGSVGVINWQFNIGGGWVSPGDSASMTSQYFVTPNVSTIYRAVLTSGGCPSDTTNILSLTTSIVSSPTATDTIVCGPGTYVVGAVGSGNTYWYATSSSSYAEATGSLTSVTVSTDTTVYVSSSSGSTFNIGKPSDFPGGLGQSLIPGHGIGFDVSETVNINRVYVYPFSSGVLEIVLRSSMGGPILRSYTTSVVSGGNETAVDIDWIVYPGNGYRMEMGPATTASLVRNTSGATYPITSPNSTALQITGFLNPNLNTGAAYNYFYNWQVADGCASPRVPLNITVLPLPAATITNAGFVLTSTAASGYQWYLNGNIITGATSQSYTATVNGIYTVVVTGANGCINTSAAFPLSVGVAELTAGSVNIYPNPVNDVLNIEYNFTGTTDLQVQVFNSIGELLMNKNSKPVSGAGKVEIGMEQYVSGIYMIVLTANEEARSYKVFK